MGTRGEPLDAPRHSIEFYDQSREQVELEEGDRLFVVCDGGPCTSRLETYPPRTEISERGGTYVLDDQGLRAGWRYVLVPTGAG